MLLLTEIEPFKHLEIVFKSQGRAPAKRFLGIYRSEEKIKRGVGRELQSFYHAIGVI